MHPPLTPDETFHVLLVDPRSAGNAGTPGTGPTDILTHGDGHQQQAARVPAQLRLG
jgi:hypothetical protein